MCSRARPVQLQRNKIHPKKILTATTFPKTAADTTFVERVKNKAIGYEPYFNRSAFTGLSIAEQDELKSMAYRANLERLHRLSNDRIGFCQENPHDSDCNTTTITEPQSQPQDTPESIYTTTPVPTPQHIDTPPYMRASLTVDNIAKYNLKTHNGGCTPPEHSNHWKNAILTSGKYQSSVPAFEKFMITVFRKEGECVSDTHDHGGYTCYGCASNDLCHGIDMQNITREKVEDLAYLQIYKKYNIDELPDAFRGYLLWGMWDSGPITGIKQFQSTLGVPTTGQIDKTTIYGAEHYTGDFAATYTKNREQFYRNIVARDPSQEKFLKGWLNGLQLLQPSGCHIIPIAPIYR